MAASLRDGGGLRFLGHPLHPALVHLPLGLWLGAGAWDVLALLRSEPVWWRLAYYCLALGLAAAALAAVAGFLDFVKIPNGDPAEKPALWHMVVMLTAATLMLAALLLHRGTPPARPGWAAAATLAGCALLAWGGWLGGELVFRHGLGVDDRAPRAPRRP